MKEGDIVRRMKDRVNMSGVLCKIEKGYKHYKFYVFDTFGNRWYIFPRENFGYDQFLFKIGETTNENLRRIKKKGIFMEKVQIGDVIKSMGRYQDEDVTGVVYGIEDCSAPGVEMNSLKIYMGADVPENERILSFTVGKNHGYNENFIKLGRITHEEIQFIFDDVKTFEEIEMEETMKMDEEIREELEDEIEADPVIEEAEIEETDPFEEEYEQELREEQGEVDNAEELDVSFIQPNTSYSDYTIQVYVRTREAWFSMTRTTAKRVYFHDPETNSERFCNTSTVTQVRRIR